jgi:hypothetical protein
MNLLTKLLLKRGGPSVTPVLTASLTSAVAPFGVVFDGVATTNSQGNDSYHDYIYFFDFGDGSAANYTYGQLAGQTKNRFVGGPVAAYVYETPGTYTARMWVSDGVSVWGPVSQAITVTDPDTVYGNANTWYIHDTTLPVAGADGVPVGATNLFVQSSYSTAMNTYGAAGRRILFRSGRTFTAGANVIQNTTGAKNQNRYIGTYGGTTPATVNVTANSITMLATSNAGTSNPLVNPHQWRVVNMKYVGTGFTGCSGLNIVTYAMSALDADLKNYSTDGFHTIHKCEVVDFGYSTSFQFGGQGNVISDSKAYCTVEGIVQSGGNGFYGTNNIRLGVVNCSFDNWHTGEHCIRNQGGDYIAIISNTIARCALGRVYITMRGWGSKTLAYEAVSLYTNVAYNYLDGSGKNFAKETTGYINFAPQNTGSNEPISRLICEGNFLYGIAPGGSPISFTARESSVRNNVIVFDSVNATIQHGFEFKNPNGTQTMIAGAHRLHNNTIYKPIATGFDFVTIQSAVDGVDVKGNLAYAPLATKTGENNGTGPTFFAPGSTGLNVTSSNNSSDAQIKSTDPLWVGPATTQAGYKLQSGSYAKDAGVNVKVRMDALKFLRVGSTFDMGALNAPDKQVDAWTLIP